MKASVFFSFLGGAALGAAIAILLAPQSGMKTRKKLRRVLKEHGIDLSREELNELIHRMRHKYMKESAE